MKGMFPEDVVIYIIPAAGFFIMFFNNSEKLNAIQSFWNTFAELFSIDRAMRSILKRIFRCILYQDVYEPGSGAAKALIARDNGSNYSGPEKQGDPR